ncbi:MAG: hypothetical protein K0S45_618 [Nitrospira sp.]|nr:hypothetical protein [Nitrospira sp.]
MLFSGKARHETRAPWRRFAIDVILRRWALPDTPTTAIPGKTVPGERCPKHVTTAHRASIHLHHCHKYSCRSHTHG